MHLTVLGASASHPAAGDACSGYLVEDRGSRLLVDCGSGVLGNLLQYAGPDELDAVLVSHLHPDHYLDLVALRYGLTYGAPAARLIPVYVPTGGIQHLVRLGDALSKTQPFFQQALELREYRDEEPICVGSLTVTPHAVVHGIPSFGIHVEAHGRRLAYTSDTVLCDEVVALARGAHVLLAENTLGGGAPDHHVPRTHMSAVEAGEVAARAGVEQLLLTHFWYTADRERARHEAATAFPGPVAAAAPHLRLRI